LCTGVFRPGDRRNRRDGRARAIVGARLDLRWLGQGGGFGWPRAGRPPLATSIVGGLSGLNVIAVLALAAPA
jgi:hypothetical protein